MANRSVRLVEVARAADVSLATASQVMNGSGRVAPATRERVLETARRLDYRPNALARSVASGRSHTVGILAENASGAFCMPVLVGANRALSDVDLASTLYDAAHNATLRREHVRRLQARHVDGVVVIGEGTDLRSASVSHEFSGPVIYALTRSDDPSDSCVLPDDEHAGRIAAQHLLELGRDRIAHVTAGMGLMSVRDRERGIRSALAARSRDLVHVLYGSFTRDWGYAAGEQLIATGTAGLLNAIVAGNDEIALGLCAQLLAAGYRIPEDIAIVGVDNTAGRAGIVDPFLTSVELRFDTVGSVAAELAVGRIDADPVADAPPIVTVPGVLIPGYSSMGGPSSARSRALESLLT